MCTRWSHFLSSGLVSIKTWKRLLDGAKSEVLSETGNFPFLDDTSNGTSLFCVSPKTESVSMEATSLKQNEQRGF